VLKWGQETVRIPDSRSGRAKRPCSASKTNQISGFLITLIELPFHKLEDFAHIVEPLF
jgi:hypothetical protein